MRKNFKLNQIERKCVNQILKVKCKKRLGDIYSPDPAYNHRIQLIAYGWLLCYYKGDEVSANVSACCIDGYLKYCFNQMSIKNNWGTTLK